ncbi:MAG: methyltransferase domain-containing protein [Mesorhizobium sp.]|nr:MAG: methyltransferase domain-containing protein [Mesorhizobium sp.]
MNSFDLHMASNGKSLRPAACPCCSAPVSRSIYRVESIPVHSCVLLNSAREAHAFPRRDLDLVFCEACGFIFNRAFDETIMGYSTNFEESQHFSSTFNSFAKGLAREIAQKCAIGGKHVLEIGCGKGEFLRELCISGGATGLGIDPAYRADRGRNDEYGDVKIIVDYFGPDYQHLQADTVLCRHTLEHVSSVSSFVRLIRKMIGKRTQDWAVFETPDAKRVLVESAFWDIYYEHCSYFSPGAHARLFRQEGFDVTDLELVYDNQYIVQYARPSAGRTTPRLPLEHDLEVMHRLAETFPARVRAVQDSWQERIRAAYAAGRRVVLWGGGSKAVSFLTTLQLGDEVWAAVDINPYKQGKFTPGTGHPVIAPSDLLDAPPDLVIVMNPIYLNEVAQSLIALDLRPEVVAV